MEAITIAIGKITLHENAADSPGSMGLGVLTGVTSAEVVRDRNSIPTLTLQQNLDGNLAADIKPGMVLVCDMGDKPEQKNQQFRVYNPSKQIDQQTITAQHIAGDLIGPTLTGQVSQPSDTAQQAWDAVMAKAAYQIPGMDFTCDSNKVANINWDQSSGQLLNILLGADQAGDQPTNTMEALYGLEFNFDNYHINASERLGEDHGIIIKYTQNMSSLADDVNVDGAYDGIIPYAKYNPNETVDTSGGQSDFDGVGDVQYVGAGGATTYDSPYKGHQPVGKVQNGTYYHVKKTASENTVNNDTWYQLDDGSWIDEHFFTFDKSGTYIVNKVNAKGTVAIPQGGGADDPGLIVRYNGVGTVTYAGSGKVAIWNAPFPGRTTTGQYVANGTRWKIVREVTLESGEHWYDLGLNQWIPDAYFTVTKQSSYASVPTQGILTIKGSVTCYTSPREFTVANWKPKVGSKWRITQTAVDANGSTLYQVSTYIWVKGGDGVDFTAAGSVQPNEDADRLAQAKATGRVPIYAEPNGRRVTEHWIKVGDQVVIYSQAENNGKTWYEIGNGQWVDASFFDFSPDGDVAPGDSDTKGGDDGLEDTDVTLLLPEKYLLAPNAKGKENPRLQAVDLSEYNVRDVDKLREVAEGYMREQRIGYPSTSLTVSYQRMEGDWARLTSVDLYDLVGVEHDQLGIAEKAEVNSITWDVLLNRPKTITIGQLPITYDHSLGKYVQNVTTKNKTQAEKKATHLFGRMHQIVKLQADDQKAALEKLADDMNISWKSNSDAIDKLQIMVQEINTTVDDVQSWISGGGSGVIRAVPNWQNPTMLTAQTGNGGQMQFSGNGLQFVGSDGIDQTAIDSRGNVVAEAITAGTIKGVTLEGVRVTGDSYLNSSGPEGNTVMSSESGFSYSPSSGSSMALGQMNGQAALRLGNVYLTHDGLNDFLYWARTNIKGFRG